MIDAARPRARRTAEVRHEGSTSRRDTSPFLGGFLGLGVHATSWTILRPAEAPSDRRVRHGLGCPLAIPIGACGGGKESLLSVPPFPTIPIKVQIQVQRRKGVNNVMLREIHLEERSKHIMDYFCSFLHGCLVMLWHWQAYSDFSSAIKVGHHSRVGRQKNRAKR